MAKTVRGSALYDDYGNMVFTAYDSNPTENTPWMVLKHVPHGTLKSTKKIVNMTITFDRGDPGKMINSFQRAFVNLVTAFADRRVVERYEGQMREDNK